MINNMQQYLNNRYFDCSVEYSITDNGSPTVKGIPLNIVRGTPLYKFNFAERMGNALLTPVDWIDKKFNASALEYSFDCFCRIPYKPLVQAALVIIGIFAGLVGLIGLAVKKIGERMNPYFSQRQATLDVVQQICKKISELTELKINNETDLVNIRAPQFLDNFNKWKDVEFIPMPITDVDEKEEQLFKNTQVVDQDAIKKSISEMVNSDDPDILQEAMEYFPKAKADWQNRKDLLQLFETYNKTIAPMRPDAHLVGEKLTPDLRNLVLEYIGHWKHNKTSVHQLVGEKLTPDPRDLVLEYSGHRKHNEQDHEPVLFINKVLNPKVVLTTTSGQDPWASSK
jgi:hypothetical protein